MIDQRAEPLHDSSVAELDVSGHGPGGVQREPATEDTQAAEELLILRGQEVVRPGNGGHEGLLASRSITGTVFQD